MTVKDTWQSFSKSIAKSTIWKSIFRHGMPDNRRDQMLVMLTNVWMHLHPTRLSGREFEDRGVEPEPHHTFHRARRTAPDDDAIHRGCRR